MKIILNKRKLIKIIEKERNLGLVPTMGGIHKGHISLIKKSNSQNSKTIATIFVNKPQFNKIKDFQKYPKIISQDIQILKKVKLDYLYCPSQKQIYPSGINKNIKIHSFGKKLCGKFRPGHFKAVVDVIERFIKIIKPKKIYFGEKDFQQFKIVEHYIKEKFPNTKVISCKTIRESNGIPFSSRNFLLSKNDKKKAGEIYKTILSNKKKIIKNNKKIIYLKKNIYSIGADKIDYLKILDINKLIKPYISKKKLKIFIAYYIGSTRLIDNI